MKKTKKHFPATGKVLKSKRGEGYVDTGVKILIAVVLGALVLTATYALMKDTVMKTAKEYICEKYFVDISGYDILRGYRADDSYFSFARAFISNSISLEQLSVVMQLGDLGEQVVLKSPKAFEHLRYLGYEAVLSSEYYTRKKYRDIAARKKYLKILEDYDKDGIYV